jgi:hypothetical protein
MVDLARSATMQQGRKMKPRGRRFPKGTSGNPKGRPKEHQEVKAAAREDTIEAIETLAFWMRSKDSRTSILAADKLLDRGWGKASQDVKLQAELGRGLAEIVRQARARVIAVDAKPFIEHEAPPTIEHEGTAETVAFHPKRDRGDT